MRHDGCKDIGAILQDGTLIDQALNHAAEEARRLHERLGLPAAVWRDGETVWVPPSEKGKRLVRDGG